MGHISTGIPEARDIEACIGPSYKKSPTIWMPCLKKICGSNLLAEQVSVWTCQFPLRGENNVCTVCLYTEHKRLFAAHWTISSLPSEYIYGVRSILNGHTKMDIMLHI